MMTNYKIHKSVVLALVMSLIFVGCSKNEYPEFDANYSALNIWFGTETIPQDSVTYNYSYALGEKNIR